MRTAANTNKALLFLTLLFTFIAAASFVAFQQTGTLCTDASKKCSQATPLKHSGGQMLWDNISHRFVTFVSLR